MIAAGTIVFLIAAVASLFLAVRNLRAHRVSFESKAWMAVAWALIIAVLAFVIGRVGG